MKTLILFSLACIISTGAFLSTTTISNPYPAFAVGFGVWIIFILRVARASKKSAHKKAQERLFNEWYRNHGRFNRTY